MPYSLLGSYSGIPLLYRSNWYVKHMQSRSRENATMLSGSRTVPALALRVRRHGAEWNWAHVALLSFCSEDKEVIYMCLSCVLLQCCIRSGQIVTIMNLKSPSRGGRRNHPVNNHLCYCLLVAGLRINPGKVLCYFVVRASAALCLSDCLNLSVSVRMMCNWLLLSLIFSLLCVFLCMHGQHDASYFLCFPSTCRTNTCLSLLLFLSLSLSFCLWWLLLLCLVRPSSVSLRCPRQVGGLA